MKSTRLWMPTIAFVAGCAAVAAAQEGNNVPTIEIVRWEVQRDGTTTVVYDRGMAIGSRDAIPAFQHEERDRVVALVEIVDADWTGGGDEDNTSNEAVYLRFRAFGLVVFGPPEPPTILEASNDFFPEEEGLRPPPMATTLFFPFTFEVPEFNGKNQRRLRGEINFDVLYELEFGVSNEQDPDTADQLFCNPTQINCDRTFCGAVENPELSPPNPPAFADAGADRTVAAGATVLLDGSRTFDSSNLGFDPSSPDVFEKDSITYLWDWISGPVQVEPVQFDEHDPIASVLLSTPGEYVYRLLVDDNASASPPTTDSVTITVVTSLPAQNPPTAVIIGPGSAVPVGTIITLDGRQSSDPDPDADLRFRWRQTNGLGQALSFDELQVAFQPLSGVETNLSTWQAVTPGTFYFRLLVDDGVFLSSATFSVRVTPAATNGEQVSVTDAATESAQDSGGIDAIVPGTCGAGLLSLSVVPLVLAAARRRR